MYIYMTIHTFIVNKPLQIPYQNICTCSITTLVCLPHSYYDLYILVVLYKYIFLFAYNLLHKSI